MNSPCSFADLQVNGYAGVDFNADRLEPEEVAEACRRLRQDGVVHALATVITDDLERMQQRLQNLCRIRDQVPLAREVLQGIHIEGPFLNDQPGYIGAHPKHAARSARIDLMERLLDAGEGLVRIVTLAPERDAGNKVTRLLAGQGICVSAGHCDPSLRQLEEAVDAGLSMFTHLGNGCPLSMHRHDNIIQRVLSLSDRLHIGLIADGVHIPLFALRNYLDMAGVDRAFIVSDAIGAAGMGPGRFLLGGREVVVDESLATWSADRSHLVGSACTMAIAAQNLRCIRMDETSIRTLTWTNPCRAIGLDPIGP